MTSYASEDILATLRSIVALDEADGHDLKWEHAAEAVKLASDALSRVTSASTQLTVQDLHDGDEISRMADAIDLARYGQLERSRPFDQADRPSRDYAFRLAKAAWLSIPLPNYRHRKRGSIYAIVGVGRMRPSLGSR